MAGKATSRWRGRGEGRFFFFFFGWGGGEGSGRGGEVERKLERKQQLFFFGGERGEWKRGDSFLGQGEKWKENNCFFSGVGSVIAFSGGFSEFFSCWVGDGWCFG